MKLRYEAHLMDGTLFDERKEGNELEAIIEEGAPSYRSHFLHKAWLLQSWSNI